MFLFNVLIIMLTLSVAMYFKREIFVLVFMSVVWLLFGIVNFVILHFRVTPFSAVDFTLISSAISVSGHYLTAFNVVMIFFAIALSGGFPGCTVPARRPAFRRTRQRRHICFLRSWCL